MNYIADLQKIEKKIEVLDETSCDTLEEANQCLIKYDELRDEIILIIKNVLKDSNCPIPIRKRVYNKAIQILTNHIGNVDDIQKYGSILTGFLNDGIINENQLNHFYDTLDIGRWK